MGLVGWIWDKLWKVKPVPVSGTCEEINEFAELAGDIYIREMAFWSAVNLISNAVSKCEFRTFVRGQEEKGREYYLWNVEPNQNQNSSGFLWKLIAQLYRNNECLVIEQGDKLYVADSFMKTPYFLFEDRFSQVTVGDFTFTSKSFAQSEVLYFTLGDIDMRRLVANLYASYSKLIAYSMTSFQKSRGTKGVFKYETLPPGDSEERKRFDDLIQNKIKDFLGGDNAALPLGKGQEWKELSAKTYASENTRDIRALINDVSDFTAKAFSIPPVILRGDVQDTSTAIDQLLTFCIDPLCDMLQEEINRKRNGYTGFQQKTRLQIDTRSVKHVDLLSVSASIDKLIASGAFSVNDIRKLLGEELIDEPWANEHFITRNYVPFEQALEPQSRGGP